MEPETPLPEVPRIEEGSSVPLAAPVEGRAIAPGGLAGAKRWLRWAFVGPQGLRAGWSVTIFMVLLLALVRLFSLAIKALHVLPPPNTHAPITPLGMIVGEGSGVLAIVIAAWILSKIERRRLTDYYLNGTGRVSRFFSGLVTGFLALSGMVVALMAGGWLHFGPRALTGTQAVRFAVEWGVGFLLVACFEEGLARCYLLFTLARGLNFWWALGMVVLLVTLVTLNPKAGGLWGAYVIALLGLGTCLMLHLKKGTPGEGFWNAAWVTTVFFGAAHTMNPGENWIGILSAAGIGFVFCASVQLTGSVWWALGCHAAWDWAETYFYGTANSGVVATGHLLTTSAAGNALWSGGTDGPEGSVLVIPMEVLILLVLIVQYGRRRRATAAAAMAEPVTGD